MARPRLNAIKTNGDMHLRESRGYPAPPETGSVSDGADLGMMVLCRGILARPITTELGMGRGPDCWGQVPCAQVLATAYAATPERLVRHTPVPPALPTAGWMDPPSLLGQPEDAGAVNSVLLGSQTPDRVR